LLKFSQVENVFTTLHGERARVARRKFEVEEGDLLTLLNIYIAFERANRSKAWCGAHFLRYKALQRAAELRDQLFKVLHRFGIELVSTSGRGGTL
jgi:ATP-dependent RNA helicase DDX35